MIIGRRKVFGSEANGKMGMTIVTWDAVLPEKRDQAAREIMHPAREGEDGIKARSVPWHVLLPAHGYEHRACHRCSSDDYVPYLQR